LTTRDFDRVWHAVVAWPRSISGAPRGQSLVPCPADHVEGLATRRAIPTLNDREGPIYPRIVAALVADMDSGRWHGTAAAHASGARNTSGESCTTRSLEILITREEAMTDQ